MTTTDPYLLRDMRDIRENYTILSRFVMFRDKLITKDIEDLKNNTHWKTVIVTLAIVYFVMLFRS